MTNEEQHWVELARTGDAEGVSWLYERYVDPIYRYVYVKLGDPTEAEDITEQVFLRMIEAISRFEWGHSSFSSWLYRIAHNLVVDTLRHGSKLKYVPIDPFHNSLSSDNNEHDPQHHAERSDFLDHLRNAMASLTDLQAQVIALKYGAGMSNAQAAEILSRTPNAVNSLQYDALRNLHKLLTLRGYKP